MSPIVGQLRAEPSTVASNTERHRYAGPDASTVSADMLETLKVSLNRRFNTV
jgi:hypothetical protein